MLNRVLQRMPQQVPQQSCSALAGQTYVQIEAALQLVPMGKVTWARKDWLLSWLVALALRKHELLRAHSTHLSPC